MRTVIIRFSIIVVAVILQASFLNLVLPKNLTIDLLSLVVLAWVIIVSFEKIWPWIVTLGIFADLFTFERVGVNVIFFIGLAYVISFFSRRFIIEKRLAGFVVIVLSVIVAPLFLDVGRILIAENFSLTDSLINIEKNIFPWNKIIIQSILNILFFYLVYFILNKIEGNIKNYENKIKLIS